MTSPNTSSWNCEWAALPTRTGAGVFVAGQRGHLPFGEATLASNAVHDLHLIRAAGGADGINAPVCG